MIKQAIIPLAGLGTRMLPLTSVMPKELIPINGKPNLEYILEECLDAGIKEFIFIIISVSPLFLMSLVSNLVEAPTEISYEGLDRKMLLLSNSFLLFFFLLPYFAIRKNSSYSMNLYRIKLIPIFIVIASTLFFIILNYLL